MLEIHPLVYALMTLMTLVAGFTIRSYMLFRKEEKQFSASWYK